jgi:hypothetical protein
MELKDWLREYKKICEELEILPKYDYDARDAAAEIMGEEYQPVGKLESLIKSRDVVIFGAGPSLEQGVKDFEKESQTLIAADGAVSCLLENGVYPDIVVTDLDGNAKDLLLADRFGAIMVVHAHGDNIDKLKEFLPQFKNDVATTQVEPLPNVRNFGGFTDGDRAVSLADYFHARHTTLIGFDFGDIVGKYSDPDNPTDHKAGERKKKKLEIAQRLIEEIKRNREK